MAEKIENIGNKPEDFIILKILKSSVYELLWKEFQYGYVAKVKSKLNNKIYAMKRIDLSLLGDMTKKRYYLNEYEMAKYFLNNNFKHKNLYCPVKTFQEKRVIYIITEYIEGNNLFDLYNKVNIKIERKKLLKIFDQCLSGLCFIHKIGIIHRKINLNNIMIDSQDRIKIINFSHAIKKNKVKEIKEKIKNGIFTAPEIERDRYDEKIDVYALGMVFNFFKSFMEKDINYNFKSSIIRLMLEKDPKERPSAEEIYKVFKNKYNNLMKACLKSFLFCFKEEILKIDKFQLDKFQREKIEKIKYLVREENNKDLISQETIRLEEKFYENGLEINDLSIKIIANFLLSTIHDDKIINDFYSYINITLSNIYICLSCRAEEIVITNYPYIILNVNEIKKEKENKKEDIKNFLFNYKYTKKEYCKKCRQINKHINSKYYKFSKYLIILIEHGIDISEMKRNIYNLDKFEFIEKEENENNIFKLISIIVEDEGSYHYYNRDLEHREFTKNEKEVNENYTSKYNLDEIKGNIICLFYRLKDKNIIIKNKSNISTIAVDGSIYDEETQNQNVKLNLQSDNLIFLNNNNANFHFNNQSNLNHNFINNNINLNKNLSHNNRGFNSNLGIFQNNNVQFQNNNNNYFQNNNLQFQNNNNHFQNNNNHFQNNNTQFQNNNEQFTNNQIRIEESSMDENILQNTHH